ncbi:MAG: hypothetical protein IJC97_04110 [Oscillospiraceae bacterium]|nr:hypothetical protein [Oscillospiraceae bacterium]
MVKKINPFNRIIEDVNTQFQYCNCKCQGEVGPIPGVGAASANAYGAAWVHFDESCRKCGGGCGCSCGSGSQSNNGLNTSANVPLHS